jgi:3-hydroxyisobutyrate dehydrogenase
MTSPAKPPLAWIGTGLMGLPMAGHLLAAGYPLSVFTRTATRARPLFDNGARQASSPADAAAEAAIVFICVNDTPDVDHVLFGATGVEESARQRPGLVIVDHSTISPTATQHFARRLSQHGAVFIDAPVSGGDTGARNGTLSIMCGGDAAHAERLRPLFEVYGKTITYCGPVGDGQLTKLVNQILVCINNLAVAEAVTFAQAAGLDAQATLSAVGGGAAGSWQLANHGPKMFAGDFAPGFMIDLQQKDLRLVLDYAREKGLPLLATSLVHQLLTSAQASGRGREGTQALVTVLRGLLGAADQG